MAFRPGGAKLVQAMSLPGRPKGEHRSAEHEGMPIGLPGRPKGEHRSADYKDESVTGASKKVYIKTFGCQMNEYDSGKMIDVLGAAQGYESTSDVEQADLILFNTCSVREKAQEKVFSDLGRVKHLKAKGVLIGVGGDGRKPARRDRAHAVGGDADRDARTALRPGAQVLDPREAHGDTQPVPKPLFQGYIDLISLHRGGPERLSRLLQIAEVVTLAAENVVDGGLGRGRNCAHIALVQR